MNDILALLTIMAWPVIPLFWIPVHLAPKMFRKVGRKTYIMPLFTWLPLAYFIYLNRIFLLSYKTDLHIILNILGILLLVSGTLLHIWTARLLGSTGITGLAEVSDRYKSRFVSRGPFSVVRHPTYLAHTMMFLGVFLFTEVIATGVLTIIDLLMVHILIIPLEDRELSDRFGDEYKNYKNRTPRFFPGIRTG